MLDRKGAQEQAERFLAERAQNWPSSNVRLILEYCFIEGDRYIAPYDNVEFLDGGNEGAQLGGNLPVCVDLGTGECGFITWDEAFDFMDRGLL
ncbi:hypothetical protein [Streptomyces sp. UNOC14_S4]|uniref:hypothetical protein n=1 Tax=Streptomyces sp. UNOC14_S4 TaxID=2872340 RepID=UPI001E364105|nr:hypothetical protein [Streptomyces sp. UNOC14_S4]MCC3770720.1 hypothetical protein [Streptomyces sp. UNOC14_S4]